MAAPVALEVEVDAARNLIAAGAPVLDVRDADEREQVRIEGSIWIPVEELGDRWRELPVDSTLVVQCAAGSRSFRATKFLREKGLVATSMIGGISAWEARGFPTTNGSARGSDAGAGSPPVEAS
jgi:rhodanese-related sulfurtransferase